MNVCVGYRGPVQAVDNITAGGTAIKLLPHCLDLPATIESKRPKVAYRCAKHACSSIRRIPGNGYLACSAKKKEKKKRTESADYMPTAPKLLSCCCEIDQQANETNCLGFDEPPLASC